MDVTAIGNYDGYDKHHYGIDADGNIVVWAHHDCGPIEDAQYGPYAFTDDEFATLEELASLDVEIETEVAGARTLTNEMRTEVGLGPECSTLHLADFDTIKQGVEDMRERRANSVTATLTFTSSMGKRLTIDANGDFRIEDGTVWFDADTLVEGTPNTGVGGSYEHNWHFKTVEASVED